VRGLQPWLSPWADQLVAMYPAAQVTSTYRTYTQQAMLYRRYLAGQSIYPAAPPGRSLHQYGRAFDLVAPAAILQQLGRIWESWGGTWGGRGNDPIHFEA
jgi:hypothetical protein